MMIYPTTEINTVGEMSLSVGVCTVNSYVGGVNPSIKANGRINTKSQYKNYSELGILLLTYKIVVVTH